MTGTQLALALEGQLTNARRRGLISVSGLRATVRCVGTRPRVTVAHPSGEPIRATDTLVVASTAYSSARVMWANLAGDEGAAMPEDAPLVREMVTGWLRQRGGQIGPADFYDAASPRWIVPAQGPMCGG